MRSARIPILASVVSMVVGLLPGQAPALSPPRTLVELQPMGSVAGLSAAFDPPFPVDYLSLSWTQGDEPAVRFLVDGRWSGWSLAHEDDDLSPVGRRIFSSLIFAADADAYQVKGAIAGLQAVAINTTDGPRSWRWRALAAEASHLNQPGVISRSQWGAEESYRFKADGTEDWPQAFYPTQKFVVHHTATPNDEPDWAARVRAIYYDHAKLRGFGDIGYNFLVDPLGRRYKGRYSGPLGTRDQDTLTSENASGYGVTGAHTGGWNSGTMGIAVLGTYTDTSIPAAARSALVDHLAWEADHHGIDPLAVSTFTNPVSGAQIATYNIAGHRDYAATECPGNEFYANLSVLRQDVAARVAAEPSAPGAPTVSATAGDAAAILSWTAPSDGGSPITSYKVYRGTASGGETLLATLGNVTTYDDLAVTNGTTYYYQVSAVNAVGEGSRSNEVSATPQAPTAPSAPQNITAKTGSGKAKGVALAWQGPASDGRAAIAGYRIYRGTASGGEAFLTAVGKVLSYKDSATVAGTVYFYRVSAVNAVGEGPQSNEAFAKAR